MRYGHPSDGGPCSDFWMIALPALLSTEDADGSGTRPERALEAINTFPRAQRESRSLPELPCERRSGPAEPSPGMPKRPEPPPEQELPVRRHSIAKKPLFGPGTAAQSMVCGPGWAARGAWSEERGAWSVERGRAAGQGESPGFSVRVWPDALLRLPAGEGSRLDLGLGWRGRLRSILSSPRFSGLSGQKNPSRGRVAEWLKAPDSKSGVLARVPGVQIPPLPPFFPKVQTPRPTAHGPTGAALGATPAQSNTFNTD